MRRKLFFSRRFLPVFMAAALIAGGIPVSAGELTSGETEVSEESVETGQDILEESPIAAQTDETEMGAAEVLSNELTGDSEEEFLSSPEEDILSGDETKDGIRYIKGRPLTEEERKEQLAPMQNLHEFPQIPDIKSDFRAVPEAGRLSPLPVRYDAREKGIVTSVKNQMPYGACWAFAMASIMETSLLKQGAGAFDLSEEHLCYFFSNRVGDVLGNTDRDYNYHHMYNWTGVKDYHESGNDRLVAEFLSTWSGMASEEEFPLLTNSSHTEFIYQNHDPSGAYRADAYLEDSVFSDYSVERMKRLLMEYDSVSIMYNAIDTYYNPDTAAYCYTGSQAVNHVVTVVGWDDNYSKENFNEISNVSSDGAWIVKNSWGDYWGAEGYFYLSYEDESISDLVCATAVPYSEYSNNYFYDGSSAINSHPLDSGEGMACVFETKADGIHQEILGEIVTHTWTDNSVYSIQVYTDLKDRNNPVSGTPAYEKPIIYSQSIQGIDTISVPEVVLEPGSYYSVIVTNQGKNVIDYGVEADAEYGWCSFDAETEEGQGFICADGQWTDLHSEDESQAMCPRIKAHTKRSGMAVSAPASVKAEAKGYNKIQISWDAVPGCDGYTVYRREENGPMKGRVSVLGDNSCTYLDKDVKSSGFYIKPGVTYTYTVRAYVLENGEKKFSKHSAEASARTEMGTTHTTVRTNNNLYNTLSWNKIDGAEGYYVYRRIPGKAWECIKVLKGAGSLKYQDRQVKSLETYQYMVKAYRTIQGKNWYSPYRCSGKIVTSPAVQKLSSAVSTKEGIRLTWKPQEKCSGYRIYRIDKNGVKKRLTDIKNGKTAVYVDKTAKKGQKYTYYVQAFAREFYGTAYSKYEKKSAVRK